MDATNTEMTEEQMATLDRYAEAMLDGDEAGALAIYETADPATRAHLDQFDHGGACSRSIDPRAPRA